ncbi:MAG: malonyl-CoA synthase [Rhizobiales bacterium]|nr:malonyl-CoA synthase [Hyphomicrobiales bacterium]
MTNTLFDRLVTAGKAVPSRVFAYLDDGRTYSHGDVDTVSARFAAHLLSLGVKPGDRVAVQVDKSIEAFMLYLATVRAGAVFLPLNTAYTQHEVDYFLGDAKPALFVCRPETEQTLSPVAAKHGAVLKTLGIWQSPDHDAGSFFEAVPEEAGSFRNVPRGPDDLAAILYTSGTTGRSKGAMLTHDNLLSNAEVLLTEWEFTASDVLLHALPIYHTHGLFVAGNTLLLAGGAMIFQAAFKTADVLNALPKATAMMGVPTFYTRLLDDPRFTREAASHMRLFVSGSAPLLAETHAAFEARTGHRILERYGMTETNMNTSNPYRGERRAGTVGFPLPGVEIRIADRESGAIMADKEIGVIEVRGRNVFKGYWKMPEKTAQEFRPDGFFITGDLGVIDDRGYVSIVGRGKDLIISGGFNIYPKELELLIDELPGVVESAVIGVPHPDFGEGVVAVVVCDNGAHLDETALLETMKEKIAKFKQPKRYVMVDELPRNAMGKVQKNVLREAYKGIFAG